MLKQFFRRLDFKPWHIATTRFRDKETGLMVTVQKDYRYRMTTAEENILFSITSHSLISANVITTNCNCNYVLSPGGITISVHTLSGNGRRVEYIKIAKSKGVLTPYKIRKSR